MPLPFGIVWGRCCRFALRIDFAYALYGCVCLFCVSCLHCVLHAHARSDVYAVLLRCASHTTPRLPARVRCLPRFAHCRVLVLRCVRVLCVAVACRSNLVAFCGTRFRALRLRALSRAYALHLCRTVQFVCHCGSALLDRCRILPEWTFAVLD